MRPLHVHLSGSGCRCPHVEACPSVQPPPHWGRVSPHRALPVERADPSLHLRAGTEALLSGSWTTQRRGDPAGRGVRVTGQQPGLPCARRRPRTVPCGAQPGPSLDNVHRGPLALV